MPRKKQISVRNICRDNATPRISGVLNKVQKNLLVGPNEAAGLITSSNRKQMCATNYQRKNGVVSAENFNNGYHLVHVAASNISTCCPSINKKDGDDEAVQLAAQTFFSPTFFPTKVSDWEMPNAVNNSKLVHANGGKCESIANNVLLEDDDEHDGCAEFDECYPYAFIKNLPELSSIVPTFRPLLLPKQTRSCPPTTLVLDLDETLVHSALEPCNDADFTFSVNVNLEEHIVFVRCRPHLGAFLDRVSLLFEIIIFTASQKIYAEQLLNLLDPKKKIFRHRVYRESCVYVDGNYLKDLSILGRDLARVVIIDNSPQAFGFQVDNGVPINSWFDDRSDQELLTLMPFLESLVGVEDVRPLIAEKYNLRTKIDSAGLPPFSSHLRGILFEQ